MSRAKRLLPILNLAKLRANKALEAFTYVKQKLQDEQAKLEQLRQYKSEYEQSLFNPGGPAMSASSLIMKKQFCSNVDKAIKQQQQQIDTVTQQLTLVRSKWQEFDARAQSLVKTIDKFRHQETIELAKAEQKQLDEYSNQAYFRSR